MDDYCSDLLKSVEIIGEHAFEKADIAVPRNDPTLCLSSVKEIGAYAFANLVRLYVPIFSKNSYLICIDSENLKSIPEYCFYNLTLKYFNNTKVGDHAHLVDISCSNLEAIGDYAFAGEKQWIDYFPYDDMSADININSTSLKYIGKYAFSGPSYNAKWSSDTNRRVVQLQESILQGTQICEYAFNNCFIENLSKCIDCTFKENAFRNSYP